MRKIRQIACGSAATKVYIRLNVRLPCRFADFLVIALVRKLILQLSSTVREPSSAGDRCKVAARRAAALAAGVVAVREPTSMVATPPLKASPGDASSAIGDHARQAPAAASFVQSGSLRPPL